MPGNRRTSLSLFLQQSPRVGEPQPQSTYIYRVQSSVWRLPNYCLPPPLRPASVSSPRTKGGGGGHNRRAVKGWGVNISEEARYWIGLLQYNPSTTPTVFSSVQTHEINRCAAASKAGKPFVPTVLQSAPLSKSPNFLVGEPKLYRSKVHVFQLFYRSPTAV
jgi:hypothetical protein